MFRREGLTEIKADIASSDDSPSLRGMAHALVCMVEHADDELAQLTAENERLLRVVEQATTHFILRGTRIYARGGEEDVFIGRKSEDPDLFAQLKGADRG